MRSGENPSGWRASAPNDWLGMSPKRETMARKPNYDFERRERERLKSEKKAKRAAEKREARDKKTGRIEASASNDGSDQSTPTTE